MKLSDSILVIISNITKNISNILGTCILNRMFNSAMIRFGIYRLFVRVSIKFGAQPIVTAKMKNNTIMLLDLRSNTERGPFFNGEYDSDLVSAIRHLLNTDYYLLDIGANIGFYTVAIGAFIKSKGYSGRVIAFEPMDANYNRLLDNVKVNDLSRYCLTNNIGLSNQSIDSQITLREDFLDGSNTGNCSISINEKIDVGFRKKTIKLERLDKFWAEYSGNNRRIDVIKMDIEGHEDFCLEGGQQVIKEQRPTILMEVNKPYYDARGVRLDERFLPLIPEKYSIYRQVNAKWKCIVSFDECSTIDNVFLVPWERLKLDCYRIFS